MKTLKQLLFESGGINQELYINDIDQQYHGVTPEIKEVLFKQWDRLGHADWKVLKYFNISAGNVDAAFDNGLDVVYPILRIEWEGGIKGSAAYDESQRWGEIFHDGRGSDHIDDLEYRIIPVGYDFLFDDSVNFGDSGYSCWNIIVELRPSEKGRPILWNGFVIGEDLFEKKDYPLQSHQNYDGEEQDLLEEIWERDQSGSYTLFEYFSSFCQVGVKVY
jgi:hypothetical protein